MNKVAILYICTGQYNVLWKEFYESFEEHFLLNCKKTYFVFTDAESILYEDNYEKVIRIEQQALKWPYSTLMRFHIFNKHYDELIKYDYVFFFNANSKAMVDITEKMILPDEEKEEDLVFVRHPAYRNDKSYMFPYDRNWRCRAYIGYGSGKLYVQGSLIGGRAREFLKMSIKIASEIDKDLQRNIIALWHDESYLNKYVLKNKRFRLLSPYYASPFVTLDTVINLRQKDNYFSVSSVKNDAPVSLPSTMNKAWNSYWFNFFLRRNIVASDTKILKEKKGLGYAILYRLKKIIYIIFHK